MVIHEREVIRTPSTVSDVEHFEGAFAQRLGVPHAFSFWKARVAFSAILRAAGIGEGDEVVLPGYTCVVVPNAILYAGARPVYADIDPATYNLHPVSVEARITPRTRALVVQHTYGLPCDIHALRRIARAHNLVMIEDSAHALGSTVDGQPVGTLGDAAFFSFQWSKPFSTGLGGMAVTDDGRMAVRLREVQAASIEPDRRDIAMLRLQVRLYRLLFHPRLYWRAMGALHVLSRLNIFIGSSEAEELVGREPEGYQKRLSASQAREGAGQLARLDDITAHRKRIAAIYERGLQHLGLPTLTVPDGVDAVLLRYPLRARQKGQILEEARRQQVEIGSWFESPLHPEGTPAEKLGYRPGACPAAEEAAAQVINLPTHPRVTPMEATRILEFIGRMQAEGRV